MMMKKHTVIAIDGPGGSGKSTVAQILAKRLGYLYVNTGAMYRAMTLKVLGQGISPDDEHAISNLTIETDVSIKRNSDGTVEVFLDGKNVTARVREPDIAGAVSPVSRIPIVRHWLVEKQREAAESDNVVCEGRDIGTVVFPLADFKFFLTASFDERARRRLGEYERSGAKISISEVMKELKERDRIDSTRKMSPLRKADDAIEIDSTDMNPQQVVDEMLKVIEEGCK
jgi:CMP/dCMP kinase